MLPVEKCSMARITVNKAGKCGVQLRMLLLSFSECQWIKTAAFQKLGIQQSLFLLMLHYYPSHASPSYPQDYLKHFKKAVVCLLIAALGGTCVLVGRQDMGRIIAHAKCQMNMRCSLKAQRRPGTVRRMPSRRRGLEVSKQDWHCTYS